MGLIITVTAVLLTLGYALGYTLGTGQSERQADQQRQALLAEQESALSSVQSSRDRLQAAIQTLQDRMGEQTDTAQGSRDTLAALQQDLADLRQDYAALNERSAAQVADLQAAEARISRLQQNMSEEARAHADAESQQQADHEANLARQQAAHETELSRQQAAHEQQRAQLRAALLQAGLDGALADTHGINWDRQLAQFEQQLTVEREALTTLQRQWRDLSSSLITELRDGSAIVTLDDVALFDSGASWPSEEGTARLRDLAELLQALPEYRITVEGHTDARPLVQAATDDIRDNWALSAIRAASTVSTLVEFGVPAERLRAVGYASNRPVTENPNAGANRRVELVLYPPIEQRVLRLRQNQGVRPLPAEPSPQDAAE